MAAKLKHDIMLVRKWHNSSMFITESTYETSCFCGFQFDTRLLVDKVLEQKFLIEGAEEGAKQMINEATVPNLKEDQVKR